MDVEPPEPSEPVGDPDAVAALLRRRVGESGLDLPVSGSSMRGAIESGSVVRMVSSGRPRPGEVWAFVGDDGRVIVHRIRTIGPDTVTHRGVGNYRDDRPVGRDRLVGRVVSSSSDGRSTRFGRLDAAISAMAFRARSMARSLGLRRRHDHYK